MFPIAKSICESSLINITLFSAKIENDFLCMVQIIWLVVQIFAFFNVGRNWLRIILPATDSNFFLVFILK